MAQQPKDLQHVLEVLEGRATPTHPSPRPGGQQSGWGLRQDSQRGRSQPIGRPSANRQGPRVPGQSSGSRNAVARQHHHHHQQQQSRQQDRRLAQQQTQAQAQQAAHHAAGPHNEPGPKSTDRQLHCTACDTWVPRRQGDWETHVSGIAHQRQLLSLRMHGERGKLVLSEFESLPGPGEPAHRLVGRNAARFGLAGAASPAAPSSGEVPARQLEAARRLRTQALAQLLSLFGMGPTYNVAGQEFSEQLLASALVTGAAPLRAELAEEEEDVANWVLELRTAATVAAASQGLPHGGLAWGNLHIRVDLEGQSFAGTAATLAALRLLLSALHKLPSLSRLTVSVQHSTLGAMPEYQLSQLKRACMPLVGDGLAPLLELNPAVRAVRLCLPPALAGTAQQQLDVLRRISRSAAVDCRRHLLLALHPRAGARSVLQLLPLPLVRAIMELAAPLKPCIVEICPSAPG